MNMEEYFRALESYVASHKLNLGDGDSVLSLLYEAYGDINRMYDDQIKSTLNMPLPSSKASSLPKRLYPPWCMWTRKRPICTCALSR